MANRKLAKIRKVGNLGKIIPRFRFCPAAKIVNSDLKTSEKNFGDFRDFQGFRVFDLANVNTNLIFIWVLVLYNSYKNIYTINPQPLSVAICKITYLTYQTFCLGLLRPFAVSFQSYDEDNSFQRHSLSWYTATSSSVFSFLFDFAIFTPPSQKIFLCLYFLKFTTHSLLKSWGMLVSNFWLVKNTCFIIFKKKKITYD